MRIVFALSMAVAVGILAGCTSGRCCGVAKARSARPAVMASGSSSSHYAPAPSRDVVVRKAARRAPEARLATYTPPPAPALPTTAACAPKSDPCAPKCDPCDPCAGGVCGVPSLDDCCPGGVCGVPTLDEIFKLGCK